MAEDTDELRKEQGLPPIGMAMAMPPMAPHPVSAVAGDIHNVGERPNNPAMAMPGNAPAATASAPAMPVGGLPAPQRPAFQLPPDKKSLTTQLWDKTANIQNPFERILARTGVGIGKALDIAGSALVPGIAMNIPGSQANTRLENNRQDRQALATHAANAPAEAALDKQAAEAPFQESEINKNNAATAKDTADAEKASRPEVPKNENPQQGYANAISEALAANRDPATDPHVQAWKQAVEGITKPQKPANAVEGVKEKLAAELAKPTPDQNVVKTLQNQIKQLDPEGQQRVAISMSGLTDREANDATKKTDAQTKAAKPYQDVLDEIEQSKEYADHPSPTNDYALLMNFIGTTKPESIGKIRLNEQELKLATGTRSSLGDLEALGNKIASGQMLTADQRKSMLSTMSVVEKGARRGLERASGGAANGGPPPGATVKTYNPKTGKLE